MKHTTPIELVNLEDLNLANAGFIDPKNVRRVTVQAALVDTGATRLSLPKPLIEELGLTPVGTTRVRTANGTVDRIIYSSVEFTVLNRKEAIRVTGSARGYARPCRTHDFGDVGSLS